MSARRTRRLSPLEEQDAWLRGRMPSEALRDYERDTEDSPLGRWLAARNNSNHRRKPRKQRQ